MSEVALSENWAGRVGGIALILLALTYTILLLSFAVWQPDMSAGTAAIATAWLEQPGQFRAMTILSTTAAVFYLPGIVGLYIVLRPFARAAMVLAVALTAVVVALIFVQNIAAASLFAAASAYGATTDVALRTAYLGAAELALGAYFGAEPLIVGLFSAATILVARAMRGPFPGRLASFVLVAGLVNIAGQALAVAVGAHTPVGATAAFVGLILNITWFAWVGVRLCRRPPRVSMPG